MLQKDKKKQVERNDNLDRLWFLVLVYQSALRRLL